MMKSGHKEFDKQAIMISTGNVFGPVQSSLFVRGLLDEGEGCIDYPCVKREPGHLQEFDLQSFPSVPGRIKDWVRSKATGKDSVIFYVFYYTKGGKRTPIGYVVTTPDHRLVDKIYARNTVKTQDALDAAILKITNVTLPWKHGVGLNLSKPVKVSEHMRKTKTGATRVRRHSRKYTVASANKRLMADPTNKPFKYSKEKKAWTMDY
jgi:hypothetical protein